MKNEDAQARIARISLTFLWLFLCFLYSLFFSCGNNQVHFCCYIKEAPSLGCRISQKKERTHMKLYAIFIDSIRTIILSKFFDVPSQKKREGKINRSLGHVNFNFCCFFLRSGPGLKQQIVSFVVMYIIIM